MKIMRIEKPKPKVKVCKICGGKRYQGTLCYKCTCEANRAKLEASRARAKERKLNSKGFKESERKRLMKSNWTLMSEYIRRRDNGVCFTCFKKGDWRKMHAGHRHHGKLNFDEKNINCQCPYCNTYLHGNLGRYERHLIERYGIEETTKLERHAWKKGNSYSTEELRQIKIDLQTKLEEL